MIDPKALKAKLDIVAILRQRGVKLKRVGSSYKGLCVFHKDTKPSLSVNPAKGVWKCFGCGVGGDVFAFVMKQDGITFPEAARKLCPDEVASTQDVQLPKKAAQEQQVPAKVEPAADSSSQTPEPAAVDRPSQEVLDPMLGHWQKGLAQIPKAQTYVKGRGLWFPGLLKALRVGYSSGNLTAVLPKEGKVRRQLTQMGILNKRGTEFFTNRLVVPIHDEAGVLTNIYGRSLDLDSKTPHLYLPGPLRGVFNLVGIREAETVILTESIIDALSLIVLGFPNTTASYGANGFTADHRATLLKAKTKRVYCAYDADPAGDQAADQLAHDLANHAIEVFRVQLPCKDPNDFIKGGGTKEEFQALLDQAAVIPVAGASQEVQTEEAVVEAAVSAQPAESLPEFEMELGDRTYRLESPAEKGPRSLVALLRVTRQDRTHVDTLNLYLDRDRAKFISRAYTAFRGQVLKKILEEDFFCVLDHVEKHAKPTPQPEASSTPASSLSPMSAADREDALEFLMRVDLIAAIVAGITRLGVVGEDENKLLVYLVATSCQLMHPLSLSVISQSSAGKSWILNRVLDMFPPERVVRLTRMSPRALFYEEPGRFKHKILFIEEAIGAKDADLGVRSMQSEKRLSNLVTIPNPKTGELKAQETVVEGPLTYMTSSVEQLDYETSTRSFEITTDESVAQTARIVDSLRQDRTLEGMRHRMVAEAIVELHRNVQRLLEQILVVNEYADQMMFPCETLRLRREANKYFSLTDTIAFLHQHQRRKKTFTEGGKTYRYIEVDPSDVDLANRLMASCLTRALSDLRGSTQELLLKIKEYVTVQAAQRGCDVVMVTFSRREVREWTKWSNTELHAGLAELSELEYVEVVSGSFGKRYVYTLSPDHRLVVGPGLNVKEKIVALGLTPADRLIDPAKFRLQSDLSRKR